MSPECKLKKVISFRNFKAMDTVKSVQDVSAKLVVSESLTFVENITFYNNVLHEALDEHAPVKSCIIKIVHNAPWFDSEYEVGESYVRKQRNNIGKQGW